MLELVLKYIFTGRKDYLGNDIISEIDVNKNDVPKGGIIVSVGSSQGFGLQDYK